MMGQFVSGGCWSVSWASHVWIFDLSLEYGLGEVVEASVMPVIFSVHDDITEILLRQLAQKLESPRVTTGCEYDASLDTL